MTKMQKEESCLWPTAPPIPLELLPHSSRTKGNVKPELFTVPERAGDPPPCSYLVTYGEKTTPIEFSQANTFGLSDQIPKTVYISTSYLLQKSLACGSWVSNPTTNHLVFCISLPKGQEETYGCFFSHLSNTKIRTLRRIKGHHLFYMIWCLMCSCVYVCEKMKSQND